MNENLKNLLNLQLFADGGVDPEGAPEDDPEEKPEKDPEGRKKPKYSDDDLDAIISRKIAALQKKQEKELDEARKLEKKNAEKTAEQKISDLESKIESYERERAHTELMTQARKILRDKGYSFSDRLLEHLVADDADQTEQNLDEFTDLMKSEVDKRVKAALAGKTPRSGGSGAKLTREDIDKVQNPIERQKLIRENLDLYK